MSNQLPAQIILAQLGGNRFSAMTGAKDFVTSGNNLSFKIGKNTGKVTHVIIDLDAADTYTVGFFNIRGASFKALSSHPMVYSENLRALFERVTGLRVSL